MRYLIKVILFFRSQTIINEAEYNSECNEHRRNDNLCSELISKFSDEIYSINMTLTHENALGTYESFFNV